MQLADLSELLEPDELILPIRGVEYRVPPCSAADWLRFQKQLRKVELAQSVGRPLAEIAEDGDPSDLDIYVQSLGSAHQKMVDDGVTSVELIRAGMTAYLWQIGQPQAAELFWASGGKAQPASLPAPSSTPSGKAGGAAPTTRSSTPTSGTSGRKTSTARKVTASRGRASSPNRT